MTDAENDVGQQNGGARPDRSRPAKPLPTDRLSIEKQFAVLRGYAAAAGGERRAVSNDDVAKIVGMSPGSVSLCNPFLENIGLLVRESRKLRPSEAVADYFQAAQWNLESAATKLAPAVADAWFCTALIPKLRFRDLNKLEAAGFLAEEAKASKDYRDNLFLLLDFMKGVGIVSIEGETVSLNTSRPADTPPPPPPPPLGQLSPGSSGAVDSTPSGVRRFSIHVPDKEDAVVLLPEDLDQDDWEMVLDVVQKYVQRWKKFPQEKKGAGQ
jgi:hypothetical protein